MDPRGFLNPLEKALRTYAALVLALVLFQLLGLGMYLVNVWPDVRHSVSTGQKLVVCLALVFGFVRSFVWIQIYWKGARSLSILRRDSESPRLADRLAPVLERLTGLLVASCVLDLLFLPAYFLSDTFRPFAMSGWRLGAMELARLLFPQAFGMAALILAYLTSQYGQLLRERGDMKRELELTI
jgi:hypothetical protein